MNKEIRIIIWQAVIILGDSLPTRMRGMQGVVHPIMKVCTALKSKWPNKKGGGRQMNNLYQKLKSRLERDFIKVEEIARILALALSSGKNVLWGPGGHGKSEMVQNALNEVARDEEIFVQSFGEGMDEATLWGGLDFKALDTEKVLRYFPGTHFSRRRTRYFEEIFDAPASVLLALKDTLTAKKLRKGTQQFGMVTKVIVALTTRARRKSPISGRLQRRSSSVFRCS